MGYRIGRDEYKVNKGCFVSSDFKMLCTNGECTHYIPDQICNVSEWKSEPQCELRILSDDDMSV